MKVYRIVLDGLLCKEEMFGHNEKTFSGLLKEEPSEKEIQEFKDKYTAESWGKARGRMYYPAPEASVLIIDVLDNSLFKNKYNLTKPKYNDEIELFIEGDCNDADYSSITEIISIEEFEKIYPILLKIPKSDHNWLENYNEKDFDLPKCLNEEEYLLMCDYEPRFEDYSPHTLTEIKAWFLCSDGFRYEIEIDRRL